MSSPLIAGRDLQGFAESARDLEDERMRRIWGAVLSDEQYLEYAYQLQNQNPTSTDRAREETKGMNFIISSAVLWVPSSPQQKVYQGHVTIEKLDDGTCQFAAVTTSGPSNPPAPHRQAKVWARSTNLDLVLAAVEFQLDEKKRGSGSSRYELNRTTAATYPIRIARGDFDRAYRLAAGQAQA